MTIQLEPDAPTTVLTTGGTTLAVRKLSQEKAGGAVVETASSSTQIPAVVPTGGSRRSGCSEVSISLNTFSEDANPHSYDTSAILRSGMVGVTMYCGGVKQTVANLQSGNEFQVCMKLTSNTSGAKCMYHLPEGGYSDVGVTTVGVSKSTDFPQPKYTYDEICCKTTHLSDFVVVEGLYILTTGWSPARGAVDTPRTSNIDLVFNMDVKAGVGDIELTPADSNGVALPNVTSELIRVTDVSRVTYSGTNVTIVGRVCADGVVRIMDNPSYNFFIVTVPDGAIVDSNGNGYNGLSGNEYNITYQNISTVATPTIVRFTPVGAALGKLVSQDTSTISRLPISQSKWSGGVVAAQKLYFIPDSIDSVMTVDLQTNAADWTSMSGLGSGNQKWQGGVLVGSTVYSIPYNSASVLMIDTVAQTTDVVTIQGLAGSAKWCGGVAVGNTIYGVPYDSQAVLMIDSTSQTADVTTIQGLYGSTKWCGGVVSGTTVYFIPFAASSVLILDTLTNTVDTTTISGLEGSSKWHGGALMGSLIYGIPYDADSVLIIDLTTHTADTTSIAGLRTGRSRSGFAAKWAGGVAVGTKIYGKFVCLP